MNGRWLWWIGAEGGYGPVIFGTYGLNYYLAIRWRGKWHRWSRMRRLQLQGWRPPIRHKHELRCPICDGRAWDVDRPWNYVFCLNGHREPFEAWVYFGGQALGKPALPVLKGI